MIKSKLGKKVGFVSVIGLLASSLLLSACGSSSTPTASDLSSKDTSGNVTIYKGPFSANETNLQKGIISNFNKEFPNIKVNYQMYDWPTMEQQIKSALSSGDYDLVYIPEELYGEYAVKGGPVTDLSSFIKNDKSYKSQYDNTLFWDSAKGSDGGIYGVPYIWIQESMYVVNLDMLKKYNVPSDWNTSLDKVQQAAIAMTDQSKGQYGIAFRTGGLSNFPQHDWYGYMMRSGADFLTSDMKKPNLNKPELEKTFQWLVDLQNKYKVTPAFGAYTWDGLRSLFQAGKIGIMHDEPTIAALLKQNPPKFKYALVDIPGLANNNMFTDRGFWVIPAASKNKAAAWQVLKYWTKPSTEVPYLNATGGIYPALKNLDGLKLFSDNQTLASGMDLMKYSQGPQHTQYLNQFFNMFQPLFDQMMKGTITPKQAIDQADQQIQQIVNQ